MNKIASLATVASWLLPALVAAPTRVARVGDLEGKVEVQLHAADLWRPAVRNLPLVERSWVRTAPSARAEIELDDGSALRLAGDALCELSDYTRLSTGQRVTLVSLDHGVAYFTGAPDRRDALILAVPGAQATLRAGARLRLEAKDDAGQIAVLQGAARFSSPVAELDLAEGQTAQVESANRARFFLYREVTPLDSDKWSLERDRLLASTGSARHVPGLLYGLMDLDTSGAWIQTGDLGAVWKPKVAPGWAPYRDGQWLWYDEVGFTWIANEPWGWLPSHYGRWFEQTGLGWVWVPGKSAVFKPGEVYWLKEASLIGWGALAPGENWDARAVPQQYLRVNTTLAKWQPDAHELIPVDAAEKLKTTEAVFVIAPPSPAFDAARLDAARPVLRAGSTRIVPILPGVTYTSTELAQEIPPAPAAPPVPAQPPMPADAAIPPQPGFAPSQVPSQAYVPAPVPEPVEVYYPAPVYTGIIVVNPPEQPDKSGKSPPGLGMPRGENRGRRTTPAPEAPPSTGPPAHSPEPPSHPAASPPPSEPHEPPPSQPHEPPHPTDGGKSHEDSGGSDKGSGKHAP